MFLRFALRKRQGWRFFFIPEEERGKTVYTALCWQNERGLTGRWSDIKSTVIP